MQSSSESASTEGIIAHFGKRAYSLREKVGREMEPGLQNSFTPAGGLKH
jgi:hypothetical protein